MSDSEVLVRCENVSKKFCGDLKKSLWYGITDCAADFLQRNHQAGIDQLRKHHSSTLPCGNFERFSTNSPELRDGEFWANKGISFELRRGECLGIIGRNGAGKTTLLKMLNGLIKPDFGRIEIRGRVGAMIALGAGFNPVLTGRENIIVNGSVLGLSRLHISDRLDAIVDFAELGSFIDAPVRTFSSGMQVRLGFAIAALLVQPDFLILDEVLAVGDIRFKLRCYHLISQLLPQCAVIFVSHNGMDIRRTCTRLIALDQGKQSYEVNDVAQGLLRYEASAIDTVEPDEFGADAIKIQAFEQLSSATSGQTSRGRLVLASKETQGQLEVSINLFRPGAESIVEISVSEIDSLEIGQHELDLEFELPAIRGGTYQVGICIYRVSLGHVASIPVARKRGAFSWTVSCDKQFEHALVHVPARIKMHNRRGAAD